jgi:hypothetical protein
MKNFLVAVSLLISVSGFANPSAFNLSPSVDKTLTGQPLLRLKVQDAQPKSGVCPYYIQSLLYVPANHSLAIGIFQETCLNDAFGASSGEVDWAVPATLLAPGQEIPVTVFLSNTAVMGSGTLVYDQPSQSFRLK